jgi:predicted acetyltransferase
MPPHPDQPAPPIELIPATRDQKPILANLLELYIHDFSEFVPLNLAPDGRFGYPRLPLYWSDPHRHPFLLRADHNLVGFALVKRGSEISGDHSIWDLAEFFILRAYRKRGLGTAAAHEVLQRFPGLWEVRVLPANVPACLFWQRAISRFTGRPIQPAVVESGGKSWQLFSFESSN